MTEVLFLPAEGYCYTIKIFTGSLKMEARLSSHNCDVSAFVSSLSQDTLMLKHWGQLIMSVLVPPIIPRN